MPHTLYLMRHGIAEDAGPGLSDAQRALTAEGVVKTRRVALGLAGLGVRPDVILASPLRRAAETAAIVAEILGPAQVTNYPALAAGATPDAILDGLRPWRRSQQVLLVGHQPDLGALASYLLTGSAERTHLPFKKAAVAAIAIGDLPPTSVGTLEWFLPPTALRAIADGQKSR